MTHNPNLKNHFVKGELENLLKEVKQKEQKHSIILLKNVLEHVISPTSTLKLIKDIMDEETLLYIDVPNDYSSFQDFLIKNSYTKNTWFCPPQHLHYFQFDSIQKLLQGEGFEIVSLQAGYPIEQFLVNEFSNYVKNKHTGKSAHLSRCEISAFLLNQGIDKYIKLKEVYGDLSFGREIHVSVKLKNKSN
ncbi:class I SAM-dependent methyltransferase [Polaribacter litorisediminis]|uniref:methyltransferase domain-containing protein n=1 Tax=Polaribacter litorisediminis TaxID=1908341 RepID=UPI001CBBF752|nr:methyltransferase domain-containing protein [Polaribacter litorisediminis]UAM97216.1 class I SAM-dependent methyltransferase [Polaribacter litorisediminis]